MTMDLTLIEIYVRTTYNKTNDDIIPNLHVICKNITYNIQFDFLYVPLSRVYRVHGLYGDMVLKSYKNICWTRVIVFQTA